MSAKANDMQREMVRSMQRMNQRRHNRHREAERLYRWSIFAVLASPLIGIVTVFGVGLLTTMALRALGW